MSSRKELIDSFKRIAWIERQMRDLYAGYKESLSDEALINRIGEIESDEARHMNMAQGILSILEK